MTVEAKCGICGQIHLVDTLEPGQEYICPNCGGNQDADVTTTDRTVPTPAPTATISEIDASFLEEQEVLAQFGNYEVIEEIARGGVGIIYKARQKGLNRIVALKLLQGGGTASSQQLQRFLQEAQSAARLQHPNIVPIHDFGVHEDQHYFTMDFIEGQSLADLVNEGPISPKEALETVRQVADALHYAHSQGVVHRDIKPGNILIDPDGRVKVTDFGLAKEVASEDMHLTVTGQVMGTPRYMSPEQASGKSAEADARSDVFSLGVTLYEMLTGNPAFEADNVVQMLQKILAEDPPPPHKVNKKIHRDVETICMKAIEKDPSRRYQSALDMTQDILRFLDGEPIEAKPASLFYRVGRKMRRHAKALIIYAVLLVITVHGIVLGLNARPSHLSFTVQTPGAVVLVDDRAVTEEELQDQVRLPAGKHLVRIDAGPKYEPQELELTTKPGETRSMTVALNRRMGTLQVKTDPPDTGITIAGPDDYRATFRGPSVRRELPTGTYRLLVHRENYLAQDRVVKVTDQQTHQLQFALLSITLWATPASSSVLSVPVVADFDGDGTRDVVVGDDDGKIYCFSGRNGIALWVHRTREAVQAPITQADLNGDKVPDVVVGSTDRLLYCLNGQNGQPLWTVNTGGPIYGPALLLDVTADGVPDAFAGSMDGHLYAVSGVDGKLLWRYRAGGGITSSLAWWTDNGQRYLLVGSLDKSLSCVHPQTGELVWKIDVGAPLHHPARVEDLDDQGKRVALLPTPTSASDARTHTAVSLSDRKVIGVSNAFPIWIDLDGDGQPEKIVVSDQGTTCYDHDGTAPAWEIQYLAVSPHGADVDGDKVLDLVFNNGPDEVVCISGRDGKVLGRIKLDAPVEWGYALEDIDRDGSPDVVLAAGRKVYCFSWKGGRSRWLRQAESYYDAEFATVGGWVFTKTIGGVISCHSAEKPDPLWTVPTSAQPSPYVGVAAGHGVVADADAHARKLRVFRALDGQALWEATLEGDRDAAIGWPAVGPGIVVAGDGHQAVICYSLTDGAERWRRALPGVVTAPTVDGSVVYVADGRSRLNCLEASTGKTIWQYEVSDPFTGPPQLVDIDGDATNDVVALSNNSIVYALNGRTGDLLWEHRLAKIRSQSRSNVTLADFDGDDFPEGVVGSVQGLITCLDLKLGRPKWIYPLGEQLMSRPAVGDMDGDDVPDVVVGTMRRGVHCISGLGDRKLWSYEVGAQIRYTAPVVARRISPDAPPLVLVGTGPPENGLHCLAGSGPRRQDTGWFGPWRVVSSAP